MPQEANNTASQAGEGEVRFIPPVLGLQKDMDGENMGFKRWLPTGAVKLH